jgi:hypothetical protein
MSISKQRIQVKNYGYAYEERDAGAAGILPGMLMQVDTDGDVIVHATEGGRAEVLVALEDSLQGNTVDDAYTVDNPVRLMIFRPGEEFLGLLEANQTISIGEGLISAGNGKLKSATDSGLTIASIVAYAMEELDTSGSSPADTLIHARSAGV